MSTKNVLYILVLLPFIIFALVNFTWQGVSDLFTGKSDAD